MGRAGADPAAPRHLDEALDAPWDLGEPAPEPTEVHDPAPQAPAPADRPSALDDLRARIAAVAAREGDKARRRAARATAALPGARAPTARGTLRVKTGWLDPQHCHGRILLTRALAADPESVAGLALDPGLSSVDLGGALFLDTETTGLGGGTGVVPFLVGLAWFEEGAMVVEQLLLEELDEEPAMLTRLRERVERASCVVTYNGKSYDWPLLEARAVLAREPRLPERPHLDLLHCSRRVYKPRLDRVRLVDMEAEVLGFVREHDVDGAEIPSLYWSYLREGDASLLTPVLEHNAHDVMALAAILAVLAERYAALHREDDPRDQLARAKVGFRNADFERAVRFAEAAAEGGGAPSVTAEAFELLARVAARRRDWTAAREALTRGLERVDDASGAFLHLELAKILEHRAKDPEAALAHARHTALAEGPEGQARREARLEARIARRARPPRAVRAAAAERGLFDRPVPARAEGQEAVAERDATVSTKARRGAGWA